MAMDETQGQVNPHNSDKNGARPAKVFPCQHEGCGKRFTRLEHLNRHALNHTAGDATCSRCRAYFKRPDLLGECDSITVLGRPWLTGTARHMDRHRQKDSEAGGQGILKTRKRSWKQVDGSIVARRPNTRQDPSLARPEDRQLLTAESSLARDIEGPISPPVSQESSELPSLHHTEEFERDFGTSLPEEDPSLFGQFSAADLDLVDNTDQNFWTSSVQPVGQVFSTSADFPFDGVFQPDTASSFNMPYTTATSYSWLFDLDMNYNMENTEYGPDQHQSQEEISSFQGLVDLPDSRKIVGIESTSPSSQRVGSTASNRITHESGTTNSLLFPGSFTSTESNQNLISPNVDNDPSPGGPSSPHRDLSSSRVELTRPVSKLQWPQSFPSLDECTREEVLDLIVSLHPISPNDEMVTRDNSLLSLSSLQTYLDLFFTRFNTVYPLIHQPTFPPNEANTLLLLAMLLLGATYSSKGAHQLAVCIHDVMRPGIFSHAGFSARPELWVLQTILLVECFGKSRAGQKQHDMSHLFHGLLINLIRRSDCQTVQPQGPDVVDDSPDDLEVVWRRWAEAEQKKRLALLCFLWDTQHAVLFCQSLCMSSFELRIQLPCSKCLWEAQNPAAWKAHAAGYTKESQFLSALKSYLTPSAPRISHLNSLSRVLILHGLMSIFWDMQRRDQTSLGVIPGENVNGLGAGVRSWRDRIAHAYDLWKKDFDVRCASASMGEMEQDVFGGDRSTKRAQQEFVAFTASYNAVYHAAQILINAEFLDLQIYAGARHILGKPVSRGDYIRSERVIKRWATAEGSEQHPPCAAKAAWHAAVLLRDASQQLQDFDAMGLFHLPWCFYIATLACWAFHHSTPVRGNSGNDDSEMVWDARAQMDTLISNMATSENLQTLVLQQGQENTSGLVWVMANVLERVRWGIIHASVMVLRGLVPWRLINQYQLM